MAQLPNPISIEAAVGSQFNVTYVLQNDNGTLMDITNKTFEFSVRSDTIQTSALPPLISVNSTANTNSGGITVTVNTATVLVTVSASAMALLVQKLYYYTLWMDQGLTDATAMVSGTMFATNVSAP